MSWDGFIYGFKCSKCGEVLIKGNGAEAYLVSYTGLCNKCMKEEPYIVDISPLDNCKLISYPPHCPSWRRDREQYYAFEDCSECGGTGRIYQSRPMSKGGPYYSQCESCFSKAVKHPKRKYRHYRVNQIVKAIQARYEADLKKAGLYGLASKGKAPEDKLKLIADPLLIKHKAITDRFENKWIKKYKF